MRISVHPAIVFSVVLLAATTYAADCPTTIEQAQTVTVDVQEAALALEIADHQGSFDARWLCVGVNDEHTDADDALLARLRVRYPKWETHIVPTSACEWREGVPCHRKTGERALFFRAGIPKWLAASEAEVETVYGCGDTCGTAKKLKVSCTAAGWRATHSGEFVVF